MTAYERDQAIKRYILSCIDLSGYDRERYKTLEDVFLAEYGHHIEYLGRQKAIEGWLRGLPSSCTIAFWNDEVLDLCERWSLLEPSASEEVVARMLTSYWRIMAAKVDQIMQGYHVPKETD